MGRNGQIRADAGKGPPEIHIPFKKNTEKETNSTTEETLRANRGGGGKLREGAEGGEFTVFFRIPDEGGQEKKT